MMKSLLVSSANCSNRSLTLDDETGIVIFNEATDIVKAFRKDLWNDRTQGDKRLYQTNYIYGKYNDYDPIKAADCFKDIFIHEEE